MKRSFWYIVCLILIAAGGCWWFLMTVGEGTSPRVSVEGDTAMIGRQKPITVTFSDVGRGLRHTEIVLTQDNRPRVLSSVDYPETGVMQKPVSVIVDAATLKLHEGQATLTVTAVDYSLWKNRLTQTWPVTIDFMPPQITQLNSTNHINPGGSCIVAYRLSEAASSTGVQVGDTFFPAYPVTLEGKPAYVAYFAIPLEATQSAPQIRIVARDPAGNETVNGVPVLIMKKKFRSDKMALSNTFLTQKMPEFQAAIPALKDKTALDTFLYVNTQIRNENLQTIQAICRKSEPRQLWQDTFLRMKNAAPMALFGDRRTWLYDGKPVGESLHIGVDLASLGHAQIEAANSGIVRFSGALGIYGNAVIIDHGLGLSTLYAHLSTIQVQANQAIKRGDVIGLSGSSGLAGGDHLHFGVAINGQFVDPREWWDPHWIQDNVTKKLTVGS